MVNQRTLPRLSVILLALMTLISCSQVNKLNLNSEWFSLSPAWNDDKIIEQAMQKEFEKDVESNKKVEINQFLVGLSERETDSIKREAWTEYGLFWRGVSTRSRYVRQPLLETLDELDAPRELQMVPVVESSYNPYVVSSVGATGLWQLMPETAADMKVKSDTYFDGRRDIRSSTRGAAKYLSKQYRRFGNWPMALAAYHLGPTAVQRRLDRRPWKPEDGLKKMPLPPITKTYIRHILGLIALHDEGEISFPEPYRTQTILLQTPVDIADLQELAELPTNQIFRFNPKLKLNQYYDGKPQLLSLRISQVRLKKLQQHIPEEPIEYLTITVAKGDNIGAISHRFNTSMRTILADNPGIALWPKAGSKLRIHVKLMQQMNPENNPMVKAFVEPSLEVAMN